MVVRREFEVKGFRNVHGLCSVNICLMILFVVHVPAREVPNFLV